jgi:hypothetical protein
VSIADHQPRANPREPATGLKALYVAWRPADPRQGWRPVGRLDFSDGLYRFQYTNGAQKPGFTPFVGMPNIHVVYESEALFPLFANRLLSDSRPEYEDFLRWGGFEPKAHPDPISILGVTEGLRQTDAIEVFPCPLPDGEGCFTNKFFLHGLRWLPKAAIERISRLETGERLRLFPDVQNADDPHAVGIRTDTERMIVGYFPRYLAHDVWQLLDRCAIDFLHVNVDHVNPTAPLQNRVLCQLRACWPAGFQPCSSDDFQPLSACTGVAPACG